MDEIYSLNGMKVQMLLLPDYRRPGDLYHGPKILWWKREHLEIYKKVSKFVLPHAYVTGRLTGLRGMYA